MAQANPLASYMLQAQQIVYAAKRPGADQAAAIDKLARLLCTPLAIAALMDAGVVPGMPVDCAECSATA